jgi:hypothetical protein
MNMAGNATAATVESTGSPVAAYFSNVVTVTVVRLVSF